MQRSGRSYDAGSHPEFNNLVEITASNLNILPGLVLKDYWVTRILRTIATDSELSKNIIFKGGTSLSKGWQLIDRFSEDVDLLTTGPEFSAPPGKNAREKTLRMKRDRSFDLSLFVLVNGKQQEGATASGTYLNIGRDRQCDGI